jgi:two-component system, NarL family, sensor kinase
MVSSAACGLLLRAEAAAMTTTLMVVVASVLVTVPIGLALRAQGRKVANREWGQTLARFAAAEKKIERARILRELHDGVCPTLLAAKCWLEQGLQHAGDPESDFTKLCARGLAEVRNALRETRRISQDLEPALLSHYPFTEALRHLSLEFSERTKVQTSLFGADVELNAKLPSAVQAALLRIAQEALANVERHSTATHVTMGLSWSGESIALTVADDGSGLTRLAAADHKGGVGLSNMRERLAEIGGTLTLRFGPAGAEVLAQVPLPQAVNTDTNTALASPCGEAP